MTAKKKGGKRPSSVSVGGRLRPWTPLANGGRATHLCGITSPPYLSSPNQPSSHAVSPPSPAQRHARTLQQIDEEKDDGHVGVEVQGLP